MSSYRIIDANGSAYNIETVAVGGNFASCHSPVDQNGVKISWPPGAVAFPVQQDGIKTGYRYAVLGLAPVATPTDVVEIQGSATKTVRIRRIRIGGVATAAGNMPARLIRRSAQDSGGGMVLTAVAALKPDTAYAAASAVVSTIGTANPGTPGTQAGGIGGAGRVQLAAAGTGDAANPLEWYFDDNALVLRGVAEFLYINMNGAALPAGAVFDIEIDTQEDAS